MFGRLKRSLSMSSKKGSDDEGPSSPKRGPESPRQFKTAFNVNILPNENVLAKNDGRDPSKGEIEIYERKPEVVTRPILDGVNPMFALLDHWERKVNALENAVGDLRMEIAKARADALEKEAAQNKILRQYNDWLFSQLQDPKYVSDIDVFQGRLDEIAEENRSKVPLAAQLLCDYAREKHISSLNTFAIAEQLEKFGKMGSRKAKPKYVNILNVEGKCYVDWSDAETDEKRFIVKNMYIDDKKIQGNQSQEVLERCFIVEGEDRELLFLANDQQHRKSIIATWTQLQSKNTQSFPISPHLQHLQKQAEAKKQSSKRQSKGLPKPNKLQPPAENANEPAQKQNESSNDVPENGDSAGAEEVRTDIPADTGEQSSAVIE